MHGQLVFLVTESRTTFSWSTSFDSIFIWSGSVYTVAVLRQSICMSTWIMEVLHVYSVHVIWMVIPPGQYRYPYLKKKIKNFGFISIFDETERDMHGAIWSIDYRSAEYLQLGSVGLDAFIMHVVITYSLLVDLGRFAASSVYPYYVADSINCKDGCRSLHWCGKNTKSRTKEVLVLHPKV